MAEVLGGIGENTKVNGISNVKAFEGVAIKKEETEEEDEEEVTTNPDQEDSSQSDYEFSLREENIRLKSRLEQAKEGMLALEKQCKGIKDELDKEKQFGDKANGTIYSLMQEKQSLVEKAKRVQPSVHHEGIQEVVRKLENEIQVLEERLDSQRKRYHQEHLLMYEDLKEERNKRQEWKKTYLMSQVAVMAFRRKLSTMKGRVSEEDIKELSNCLELVFHEQDGRLKEDLIRKKEEACVEGSSKYTTHINNVYNNSKEMDKAIEPIEPSLSNRSPSATTPMDSNDYARNTPNQGISLKHAITEEGKEDPNVPKVFIMDDQNKLVDPQSPEKSLKDDINVKLPPMVTSRVSNVSTQRYELAGNKHHHHSVSTTSSQPHKSHGQSQDPAPQYKHWHHYSVAHPGHNPVPSRKTENPIPVQKFFDNGDSGVNKKSLVNTLQRLEDRSYKSKFSKFNCGYNDQLELNVNDTKFLELNFDHAFLKGDLQSVPSKLQKSLQQKNGIRTEAGDKKVVSDEKKLYCLTCDKEVANKLCGHTNIIIQEKEKEFPCPTCARVFTNRSHLKRHNMIHSGEKPFACTYCDKRFNRKSHLSRHLLTHTGEKPFKCPTCDKGFADNSDLKRHKQIHEVPPGLVPILPKDNQLNLVPNPLASPSVPFPMQETITSGEPHKIMLPTKRKDMRFPCSKCGKQFSRKSHLTRHKLTHDQVKIYCDCGRLFRQNAHLQAHLPACRRKREAVEAKYLAHREDDVEGIESIIDPTAEVSSIDSDFHLSVPGRLPACSSSTTVENAGTNDVKSVGDFKARLAAKFNGGVGLNEELISLDDRKIKVEDVMNNFNDEDYIENSRGNIPSDASSKEVSGDELCFSNSTPFDIPNQYMYKSNLEQRINDVNEHNFIEDKFNEQKISDINFNLIVKNGTSKLQNDDLALDVDTLPCLPIEIPPLLNE